MPTADFIKQAYARGVKQAFMDLGFDPSQALAGLGNAARNAKFKMDQTTDAVDAAKPIAGAALGGLAGTGLRLLGRRGGMLRNTPLGLLGALGGAAAGAAIPADKVMAGASGLADQMGVHKLRAALAG